MRNKKQLRVTMGWDGAPTILLPDGSVLPRRAERVIHAAYYPDGGADCEWPRDPETGERLPAEPLLTDTTDRGATIATGVTCAVVLVFWIVLALTFPDWEPSGPAEIEGAGRAETPAEQEVTP